MVVVHVVDIVGAQTVLFSDAEQLVAGAINEDDTVAIRRQSLHTDLQVLNLCDVGLHMVVLAVRRGTNHARFLGIAVVVDSIHFLVAGQEVDVAAFFPNPLHLALKGLLRRAGVHVEVAVSIRLQVAEVVVAARPQPFLGVLEYGGDAGNARRVDDAPVGIVVIEQSLEVGHIYRAVVGGDDVGVHVVGLVFGSGEVAQVGDTLSQGR